MFFNYIIIRFNKLCIIGDIGTVNLYKSVQRNQMIMFSKC